MRQNELIHAAFWATRTCVANAARIAGSEAGVNMLRPSVVTEMLGSVGASACLDATSVVAPAATSAQSVRLATHEE